MARPRRWLSRDSYLRVRVSEDEADTLRRRAMDAGWGENVVDYVRTVLEFNPRSVLRDNLRHHDLTVPATPTLPVAGGLPAGFLR